MSLIPRLKFPHRFIFRNARLSTLTTRRMYCFSSKKNTASNDYDYQDDVLKSELLTLALEHVNSKGWSRSAIMAGAEDLNMSGEVGNIFTEYDLVKFFLQKNNEELESYLRENKVDLKEAMTWKVGKIMPYAPKLNEALAVATQPENIPESIRQLQNFSDIMAHYALKDTSADLTWYAKRAGVASIYVATELYLLQDKSENYEETWRFLERRIKDFGEIQQGSLLPFTNALPEVVSIGVTTALNILGRNKKR